jgi:hypothetical protein
MHNRINHIEAIAGAALKILGRARLSTGAFANPTDVTQIDAKVKQFGEDTPTFDGSLSPVATYLLDHLATSDPTYTRDTNDDRTQRGYNFLWTIPASAFPAEGWYTVEVMFTDANGVSKLLWQGPAVGTLAAGS